MVDWFSVAIWSLAGTWALVVGTLFLMYWQTRTDRHLNSANAVMDLRERFDSGRMRAARRHLSERLLKGGHQDVANLEVVTFFELVATLTHRRVLDDDLVWEAFGTWVEAYYWGLRHPHDLISQVRRDLSDPLIFHEFEWLHERILSIDRRAEGSHGTPISEEMVRRILQRESQLESV
ncbi:MAG TPA: hypothetical protein VEH57_04510 [Thermoplasmata archaeon]|nr:hypothetical protein [Thermoplasmata archaeon]